ncbi:WD40-repeat-containing domain protein [Mycena metata]|uniref:Serine-threonine kinase receptor-associated protein n=1 Tax=Mycena metata TaxID=1033252 RepID=A0AAD7JC34_9AGAR|nr:WD40-repeat-containing domain protein [Mycena metata]
MKITGHWSEKTISDNSASLVSKFTTKMVFPSFLALGGLLIFPTETYPLARPPGHERSLTQIKFNKEGDLLFSCSKDHIINVWYSHNGERLGTYNGNNGTVWTVDVDSESRFLVSGAADNTLRLWAVESGKCLYTWEFPTAVKRVAFNEDDSKIVCITEQRMGHQCAIRVLLGGGQAAMDVTTTSLRQGKFETRFWHKVYEEEVGRVRGHFGPINTIAVHPAGTSYASGGEDGFIRLHHYDDSYFKAQPYGAVDIED